ncbi:MAG: acetate uptake transporter, partial [Acidiferrobacterales bacterium]
IGWGVFTLYMWIATFRLSKALWWVFLTLWITFFLLGFGALLGKSELHVAGGWLGLVCGLLAMYTSFALVTNATFGKTVIPVGAPRG